MQQGTYSPAGSSSCIVNKGFAIGCTVLGFAILLAAGRLLAPRWFCVEPTAAAQRSEAKGLLAGTFTAL